QAGVLAEGGRVTQETRHFHEDTGQTTPGRSKEQAEDYRYFPEPDLVPIAPDPAWVEELRASLPEQPSVHRARLAGQWGIGDFEMASLVNAGVLGLVEQTVAAGVSPDAARKWWAGELTRVANEREVEPGELGVSPADIGRIEELIASGSLNDKLARQVFEGIMAGEGSADEVVATRGLAVVSDDGALLAAIDEALAGQPEVAEKIKAGKVQAAGAIVGAVMKATRGQADAGKVRELLLERLGVAE
ncbi:MAG: Asp-tRNA(Asn)/Glu-tRNA(Gln) amidotransferase GatCAB subunit B, partial [Candidatus Nanopelagicales bacterium]